MWEQIALFHASLPGLGFSDPRCFMRAGKQVVALSEAGNFHYNWGCYHFGYFLNFLSGRDASVGGGRLGGRRVCVFQ